MTPREILAEARHIITDTDMSSPRQSDGELLQYLNSAIAAASVLREDLFMTTGDLQCQPGQTEQGVSFGDAKRLVGIVRIKNGRAVLPGDLGALQAFNPDWGQDAAAAALNWYPYPGDPLRFYIHPKAPDGQILETKYIRNPSPLAESDLDTEIADLPPAYKPALVHYVVGASESKDDEHVLSQRAAMHIKTFTDMMMAGIPQQGA